MLEYYPAAQRRHDTPLLLLPGAFAGAWLWHGPFIDVLTAAGFDTYALSFRGHQRRRWHQLGLSLKHYLEDIEQAVEQIGQPPALVGYSLGGFMAYQYARRHPVPALVLLAAVPPDGVWGSLRRFFVDDPVSASKMLSLAVFPPVRHLGSPPRGIYSDAIDQEQARAMTRRLRAEPPLALLQALRVGAVQPLPQMPVWVLGATGDTVIPPTEVQRTAQLLQAPCQLYEGMSHSIMLEPGAAQVAQDLVDWMAAQLSRAAA